MVLDPQAAAQGDRDPGRLPSGTRLAGGRYIIDRGERRGLFADLYQATDATTGAPLSIHLIDPRLVQSRQLLDQLADRVRRAAAVEHGNIARAIELAVEGQHIYIATELVEGHSLRELLDRKRETGTIGFGTKGAVNILTQVASALSTATPELSHGAVTIDGVAVSRSGRIRVTDFGLSPLVPVVVSLGRPIPGCPPEVVAGEPPTVVSDVYCLGALLYEVLVGAPPVRGCMRPSRAVPGIAPAVDQIIARAMSPSPGRRFLTPGELVEAVTANLADAPRLSVSHPPQPASARSTSPGRGTRHPGAHVPVAAAESQPSLAEALASAGPGASAEVAVSPSLAAALANRDERWLISRGKLDYGPFSLRLIAEQIQANQILPGEVIVDKDTGDRRPVEEHPLLSDLVEAATQKRDELRRAQAEVQHATKEKRRGAALYSFIGLGVLALGSGVYFLVQELGAAKRLDGTALESLEAGSLEAEISFPTKAERQKRARRNAAARSTGRAGGAGGVAGGWDDSLNLDISDEDADEGGSDRLTDEQVNPVIRRQSSGLGRCMTASGTHSATIEFIVKPDGSVSHVRVSGQTATPVANCVRGVMTRMQFPRFDGVRSKHVFDMHY